MNGLPRRIDVLINNAGLSSRGMALDTDMGTLERLMVSLLNIIPHGESSKYFENKLSDLDIY